MADEPKIYRRLAGWLGGRRRLFLGPDHLLAVSTLYGVERYRRFFLRDIRAIMVRRTVTGRVLAIIYGVLAVALLGGAAAVYGSPSDPNGIFFGFLLGLGAMLGCGLALELALGPTCAIYVQTLAGAEPLETPARWRVAVRLQRELQPIILAAQTAESAAEASAS